MHVLIIPSEGYPDADSHLQGIFQQHQAHALKRAGLQVGVASVAMRSLRGLRDLRGLAWARQEFGDDGGIPVARHFGWHWVPYLFRAQAQISVSAGIKLFDAYCKRYGRPDLVHAHNALLGGVIAAEIQRRRGVPFVITEHSTMYARGMFGRSALAAAGAAYRAAQKRIVVSGALAVTLEGAVGDSIRPWTIIPNVLERRFEQLKSSMELSHADTSEVRLLTVGALHPKKGHADLLQAFARSFGEHTDAQLRIGGIGPIESELRGLAQSLGVMERVHFLGLLDRDAVLREMLACDLYVQPSRYETFGVVIIEALACGKPVVATRCGGPEEIISEKNGLITEPGNVEELGAAIKRVLENRERYSAQRIREECVARYGEAAITEQLVAVYREVSAAERSY